ncbi:aspartate/glutamate racemase family protein [Patescibacteria group bacterium]|nr:aspartate/glutamate racemase family protein [Patescibacteria group bacterium]
MIGIFDSGSGGLTVLKALRDVLPSADVVYFGDIKNVPYGGRSREELSNLTVGAMRFLHERGARMFISACNSVSASLALSLFDAFEVAPNQLVEMVGPTVACFKGSPDRVLLCATPATVRSEIYQTAFRMVGKDITTVAIPELAGAIERGERAELLQQLVVGAFQPISLDDYDTLVLACTHYPLITDIFKKAVPKSLGLFDPALAAAERVEKLCWPREVGGGSTHFILSQDSAVFRQFARTLLPGSAHEIEILS